MPVVAHEPVLTAIAALLAAAGGLLAAFGVHLTAEQTAAVGAFAAAAVGVAFIVRAHVTPAAHLPTPPPAA